MVNGALRRTLLAQQSPWRGICPPQRLPSERAAVSETEQSFSN